MSATTSQPGVVRHRSRSTSKGRSPITLVRPRPRRAARAPFVVLVLVFLVGGLALLLVLNTLLAQGSFTVRDLNIQASQLQDRQQALQQKVSELASPQRLQHQAAALGMVPAVNPAFLRLSDGKILGDPVPASAPIVPETTSDPETPKQSDTKQSDTKQSDNAEKADSNGQANTQGSNGQQTGQSDTNGSGSGSGGGGNNG